MSKSINPASQFPSSFRKKSSLTIDEYVSGIQKANKSILSQAITIVESTLEEHQILAGEIIARCIPLSQKIKSLRIGITGAPGVGKSTFIEALGVHILQKGEKVAVLAIDPSSQQTSGSILGDKTRMQNLSTMEATYIRPSPAGSSLGGVARKTRESIILCEAAGFNHIIVETVGVGQSETSVHSMVDLFLLLLLPGAGDELQGIKRGIVEMADLLAVNKADGERTNLAKLAKKAYQNALHLMPVKENGWTPEVMLCSALENEGIDEIWKKILAYQELTKSNSSFEKKRQEQALFWMKETIWSKLKDSFYGNLEVQKEMKNLEQEVLNGNISPFAAAEILLKLYNKH